MAADNTGKPKRKTTRTRAPAKPAARAPRPRKKTTTTPAPAPIDTPEPADEPELADEPTPGPAPRLGDSSFFFKWEGVNDDKPETTESEPPPPGPPPAPNLRTAPASSAPRTARRAQPAPPAVTAPRPAPTTSPIRPTTATSAAPSRSSAGPVAPSAPLPATRAPPAPASPAPHVPPPRAAPAPPPPPLAYAPPAPILQPVPAVMAPVASPTPEPPVAPRKPLPWILRPMTLFAILVILLSGIASATWTQIDLDKDGLNTSEEWKLGTRLALADSDGDGLGDGWEQLNGLAPLNPDSDADALTDSDEVKGRINPLDPDMDDDTLLDGRELALGTNLLSNDTDGDALSDAQEAGTEFDPLDPDSFGISLPDSVVRAFRDRGQPPSGDADHDGIPDEWETNEGLIDWGAFTPQPNRTDLLIEFVRIQGPEAARFPNLDFSAVYETVRAVFLAEGGIHVQYQETILRIDAAEPPDLIPSVYSDYYADVLEKSRFAENPYTTTVVLNPEHDQSEIAHLGVAPIRGMLAAVDFGMHTVLNFKGAYVWYDAWCNCTFSEPIEISFVPGFESLVRGNRQDLLSEMGVDRGYIAGNGEIRLEFDGAAVAWKPYWFATAPRIEWSDGSSSQLYLDSYEMNTTDMAQTLMHELGHTLGLCHLEDSACATELSNVDEYNRELSTMYTDAKDGTIHFLGSEWKQVKKYVQCPPAEPLALLAEGADSSAIIESKYGYLERTLDEIESRECGEFTEQKARSSTSSYASLKASSLSSPDLVENSATATYVYAASSAIGTLTVAGGIGLGSSRLGRRK